MTRLTDAEQILQELGITEPVEIDLEAIAWHVGAIIKRRPIDGCEARIVGTWDRAIITVNSSSALVRQRFSIGHELGHWHNHRGRSLVCRSEEIGEHGNVGAALERQADAYAANLLLPGYILRPILDHFQTLTFDVVRQIAKTFKTSLPATAIRLVEHGSWPAILVCHGQSGRKWFVRNHRVPDTWFPRSELDSESYALGLLFGNDPDQTRPCIANSRIWFGRRDANLYDLQEQSVRSMDCETLSLLLINGIGRK